MIRECVLDKAATDASARGNQISTTGGKRNRPNREVRGRSQTALLQKAERVKFLGRNLHSSPTPDHCAPKSATGISLDVFAAE